MLSCFQQGHSHTYSKLQSKAARLFKGCDLDCFTKDLQQIEKYGTNAKVIKAEITALAYQTNLKDFLLNIHSHMNCLVLWSMWWNTVRMDKMIAILPPKCCLSGTNLTVSQATSQSLSQPACLPARKVMCQGPVLLSWCSLSLHALQRKTSCGHNACTSMIYEPSVASDVPVDSDRMCPTAMPRCSAWAPRGHRFSTPRSTVIKLHQAGTEFSWKSANTKGFTKIVSKNCICFVLLSSPKGRCQIWI